MKMNLNDALYHFSKYTLGILFIILGIACYLDENLNVALLYYSIFIWIPIVIYIPKKINLNNKIIYWLFWTSVVALLILHMDYFLDYILCAKPFDNYLKWK